ncbi:hypothetical protein [Paracoccus sp. PAR01]|nr:hypothetical protein [Paracoccus sp. PAR01]MBD9528559.1 hypothetical protein [Paracoccus sp. PAR01]
MCSIPLDILLGKIMVDAGMTHSVIQAVQREGNGAVLTDTIPPYWR